MPGMISCSFLITLRVGKAGVKVETTLESKYAQGHNWGMLHTILSPFSSRPW
jgi:hypothetical protein